MAGLVLTPESWDAGVAPLAPAVRDQYLDFVGEQAAPPSLSALARLVQAHLHAIPFENVSTMLDEPVSLDASAIAAKLLSGRRGGYCFEHNLLFARALSALGYDVGLRAGRILLGAVAPRPRSHLVVQATLDGVDWLADVGFGRNVMHGPVQLSLEGAQRPERHAALGRDLGAQRAVSVVRAPRQFRLDLQDSSGAWEGQYVVETAPAFLEDVEQMNGWVSGSPWSHLRGRLTVMRAVPGGRRAILGDTLMVDEPGRVVREQFTVADARDVLADEFGIELPAPLPALARAIAPAHRPALG